MAQIVLMIPRQTLDESDIKAGLVNARRVAGTRVAFTTLPWIPGECDLDSYKYMMLATNVTWSSELEGVTAHEGRRTAHSAKINTVSINRRLDMGSAQLTKATLQTRVSPSPWEIYFLRSLPGDETDPDARGFQQVKFMTMRLHNALVTKYSVGFGEGDAEESIDVSPTAIEWIYHRTSSGQVIQGNRIVKYDVQSGSFG